jgi:hypothetical protein
MFKKKINYIQKSFQTYVSNKPEKNNILSNTQPPAAHPLPEIPKRSVFRMV